jgi:hypothetical protein
MSSSGITALLKQPQMLTTITPSDRVILAARVRRRVLKRMCGATGTAKEGLGRTNVQLTLCMMVEVKSKREREREEEGRKGGSGGCAMLLKGVDDDDDDDNDLSHLC